MVIHIRHEEGVEMIHFRHEGRYEDRHQGRCHDDRHQGCHGDDRHQGIVDNDDDRHTDKGSRWS